MGRHMAHRRGLSGGVRGMPCRTGRSLAAALAWPAAVRASAHVISPRAHARPRSIARHRSVVFRLRLLEVVYMLASRRQLQVPRKNRIASLRAERAWTQADLAQRVRVSRQTINAIETGKFDPSLPVAFRIARLFDLTIEEIFSTIPA